MAEVKLDKNVIAELRKLAFAQDTVVIQTQVLDALLEAVELLRLTPSAAEFMWTLDGVDPRFRVSSWRIKRELLLGSAGLS